MCGFEPGMFRSAVRRFHTAPHPRTYVLAVRRYKSHETVGVAHCTISISSQSSECRAYLTLSDLVDFKVEMIYPNYKKNIFTIINPLLSK